MPAITTSGLSRCFGDYWAVNDLSIEVAPGEVLALLGPNGAGKTTTVRLLNGILRSNRGQATVLGLDPDVDGDELRRYTGVLTENAGLDDRLTARENLEFIGQLRGMSAKAVRARVDDLLEQFAMTELADQRTKGFSTGERKRVALARALLHEPELLFLDEPTSGLDPAASREVVDLIEQLSRDQGRTVVLCTHFLGEAGRLADRMAFLHHGQLRAFGRPAQLAADIWTGLEVSVDLDGPADAATLDNLRRVDGVRWARADDDGARVELGHRTGVPALVASLVAQGRPVFGVTSHAPTLEDVYFALETRIRDDPNFRVVHTDDEAAVPA